MHRPPLVDNRLTRAPSRRPSCRRAGGGRGRIPRGRPAGSCTPDLAPQRERSPELDAPDGPRLRAPALVQHHAQDAVDAEPGTPGLDLSFLGKFAESLVEAYRRDMTDLDRHWLERLQVMGKVQSRYLWILLITMIFTARCRHGYTSIWTHSRRRLWISKSADSSFWASDRRLFRFSCWPSPAPCAQPARPVRSSTLDAATGVGKNSTPPPMHSTWPSTPLRRPRKASPLLLTSATWHSWLSASMRPLGSRSSYGMLKRRLRICS